MNDLVDGKRCSRTVRILRGVVGEAFGDFGKPFVKLGFRAGVERGKRPHDARLALGHNQRRMGNDEQGCGNDWKPEIGLENGRKGHRASQITVTFTQTSIPIAEPG